MDRVAPYEGKTVKSMDEVIDVIKSEDFIGQFGCTSLLTIGLFAKAGKQGIYIDEELSLQFPHATDRYTGYTLKVEGPAETGHE